MKPFKESIIDAKDPFPVDVFIQDNEKANVIVNSHWHDCIEILYMIEGTAQQQVNDKKFDVFEHDIIILNKGDIHGTWCEKEATTKILVIKFMPEIMETLYSHVFETGYILTFLNKQNKQNFYVPNTHQNAHEIFDVLMGIYREFSGHQTGYEIYIKGYIYQLIALLIRNDMLGCYDIAAQHQELAKLKPVLTYIEQHYKEEISLVHAANMANMSYYHFSRFFKKVTGKNYKEYIDFVRICEAEKHILSEHANISHVAYEVGFNNVSSFNRVYKRVRGYPPSAIKKAKNGKI